MGDDVAHGGAAVPGHDHAIGVAKGDDRGGMRGTGETGLGTRADGAAASALARRAAAAKWHAVAYHCARLAQEPDEVWTRIALRGKKGKSHW